MTTTRRFEAVEAPIESVVVSPLNVRRDVGDITELADSIREQGILEPLIARPGPSGEYEVIIGSRRLAAARQVGLATIPLIVREASDAQAIVEGLIENLQRGDLPLEDRVEAYKQLQESEPTTYGTTRGLARAIGRDESKIRHDFDAYSTLVQLRPHGIQVRTASAPSTAERQAGEAIPERHAMLLQRAMTAVGDQLSDEEKSTKYQELARAIAPNEEHTAARILDYFKMYPYRAVNEIVGMATARVERPVNVSADTARRLEDLQKRSGARDWGEAITSLVEQAPSASEGVEQPSSSAWTRQDQVTQVEEALGGPREPTAEERGRQLTGRALERYLDLQQQVHEVRWLRTNVVAALTPEQKSQFVNVANELMEELRQFATALGGLAQGAILTQHKLVDEEGGDAANRRLPGP